MKGVVVCCFKWLVPLFAFLACSLAHLLACLDPTRSKKVTRQPQETRQEHTPTTKIYTHTQTHNNLRRSKKKQKKKFNIRCSNVVPHRSTNRTRTCLTSLSRREAVLSCLYGRIWRCDLKLWYEYRIWLLSQPSILVADPS